jgi:hypothetical protein
MPRRLFVGPSARQLFDRPNLVVNDRGLIDGRSHRAVTLLMELIEQLLKVGLWEKANGAGVHSTDFAND